MEAMRGISRLEWGNNIFGGEGGPPWLNG